MPVERRWIKFWPQDWQRDPALRSCGVAARGLWMDMICIAHEGNPYGHVTINGKGATARQVGSITGMGEKEATRLIAELEEAGVFSRSENGTIYSRRMVRDFANASDGATSVQKRWGEGEETGKTRSARLTEARRKGKHTEREWLNLLDLFKGICPRCNLPFKNHGGSVKDHITPIYQGGSDSIENIQPLCQRCNASKGPDTTDYRPEGWRQTSNNQDVERLSSLGVKRLGNGELTPTLEAEAEAEAEKEAKQPLPGKPRARPGVSPNAANPPPKNPLLPDPPPETGPAALKFNCFEAGTRREMVGGYYWDRVEEMVCEAVGLEKLRGDTDEIPVRKWLIDGIEPDVFLPVIRRCAERANYQPPGTMKYFDTVVRESFRKAAS